MSNQLLSAKVCSSKSINQAVIKATNTIVNVNSIKKVALRCPDCKGWMSLREGKYGLSYFCNRYPYCQGNHKATKKGKPLGLPANKETRNWRIKAHKSLESLYRGEARVMTKTEAYAFLAYIMGLTKKQAHIAKFTLEQCKEAVEVLDFN